MAKISQLSSLTTITNTTVFPVVSDGLSFKIEFGQFKDQIQESAQGATGLTGPAGATGPGATGATGFIGPAGSTGATGLSGLNGVDGATGPVGATGADGTDGTDGVDGVDGVDGATGATGLYITTATIFADNLILTLSDETLINAGPVIGATGLDGPEGATGPQGIQGATGGEGSTGPNGPIGPQGYQGATGVAGATGPAGATGEQGDPGDPGGATGPQGATGVRGATGSTGPSGVDGDQGATGAQGVRGATGSTGPIGATGLTGSFGGITVIYEFSTNAEDSDPGLGKVKFNDQFLPDATKMFLDDDDINGTDIQSFLRTIDDSTSPLKGHFRIGDKNDPRDFAIFTITSLVERDGYFEIVCSFVDGVFRFDNETEMSITFARTGDLGPIGSTGPIGATGPTGPGFSGLISETEVDLVGLTTTTFATNLIAETQTAFDRGQYVMVKAGDPNAPDGEIYGRILSYTGTFLTLESYDVVGEGTFANWTFQLTAAKGATGATGPAGSTGPSGEGATGATGPAGATGEQGDPGGATGPAGATGATGPAGEGSGNVNSAGGEYVDNAVVRYDGNSGDIIQNSLVTISDSGAITAPATGNIIPFLWDDQNSFPSASTYHGAIAHSHSDGRMYFAHAGTWLALANFSDIPEEFSSSEGEVGLTGATGATGPTGPAGASISWSISSSGSSDYVFSGPGIVEGNTNDPVLYLYRGFTYTFINTTGSAHPFAIRVSNGGAAYTAGVSGSQSGTQTFTVPMNAPSTLYYQCTIHSSMGNVINIV